MHTGGIQTLIVRFSKYYKNKGHKLKVLLTIGGGSLMDELQENAEVKIYNSYSLKLSAKKIKKDPFYNHIDEVFTMFPDGNWLGLQLAIILKASYKVGIYHPEDYGRLTNFIYRKLFDVIPDSCKLFMNNDCLENNEKVFRRTISSEVLPLPVIFTENQPENNLNIFPIKNSIISIGRFDPYKTYNLSMIEIIKKFQEKGIKLYYYLYGYGILEEKMKTNIILNKLSDQVIIKGILEYSKLITTVKTAYIFVGCGTAAIEASYAGVPTIIATISTNGISNGLFTDEIGYNIGEQSRNLSIYKIEDLIEKILQLPEHDYKLLCEKHTEVAKNKYGVENVFAKYFYLPKIYVNKSNKLNLWIKLSSIYFMIYKFYKDINKFFK
jgi:hypothetical protein